MRIINCEQGTSEWFEARKGMPSASCFDEIVTTKGEPSKSQQKYMYKLAGESLLPLEFIQASFQSTSMQRGKELESEARELFELVTGDSVLQVGCFINDNIGCLCSPDGIIDGKEIGLEIKCPELHTHVKYLLDGKLPTEYIQQVQGSLMVSGFKSWMFMSYYPGLQPFIIEVFRDEEYITAMKNCMIDFVSKLYIIKQKLKEI